VLEKNQACASTSLKFHQLKPVLDIYIVADTEGKEMVLKLHRLALNLVFGFSQNLNEMQPVSAAYHFERSRKREITLESASLHRGCICRA
jgi:hypothetical protein